MKARLASSLLGFWLAISPLVLHHAPNRGFTDMAIGLFLMLNGVCGVWMRGLRVFDGLAGLALVASVVLGQRDAPLLSIHDLVLGAAFVGLSMRASRDRYGEHDHWVGDFDLNPRLERGSMYERSITGE